jgi:antitoxin ParD1/3/4
MANTSLTLGEHWEGFIRSQVVDGRYASASEVVRDALRHMENRENKLNALRAHLAQGAEQIAKGEGIENFSMASLIEELDTED